MAKELSTKERIAMLQLEEKNRSPGIERELKTDEHIELSVGQKVQAKLFVAKDGKKSVTGILTGADKASVTLDEDGAEVVLQKSEIAKLTTVYFE